MRKIIRCPKANLSEGATANFESYNRNVTVPQKHLKIFNLSKDIKKAYAPYIENFLGNSLAIQWLGLPTSTVGAQVQSLVVSDTLRHQWTVACQPTLSLGFSGQECRSGLPMPFSRGSSWPRDRTWVSCIAGGFIAAEPPRKPRVHLLTDKYLVQLLDQNKSAHLKKARASPSKKLLFNLECASG